MDQDRLDKNQGRGYLALVHGDIDTAERSFRLIRDIVGLAITAVHAGAWERAMNKAVRALANPRLSPPYRAIALKILLLSVERVKAEEGSPNPHREKTLKQAETLLEGVDWEGVHRHLRKSLKDMPQVFAPIATERFGKKLLNQGVCTAAQLLLDGEFHKAQVVLWEVQDLEPEPRTPPPPFLCEHCMGKGKRNMRSGDRRIESTDALVRLSLPMFEKPPDSREVALLLGVAGIQVLSFLAKKGEWREELAARTDSLLANMASFPALDPSAWESAGSRVAATTAVYRARLSLLRKAPAEARRLLDPVASGPEDPWNTSAQDLMDEILESEQREVRLRRIDAQAKRARVARAVGDDAAEHAALLDLVQEDGLELEGRERLAHLAIRLSDSSWLLRVTDAARRGSRDAALSQALAEEALREVREGHARKGVPLFRLAREVAPLGSESTLRFAEALLSLGRHAEAAALYEGLGATDPACLVLAARSFFDAGRGRRALAILRRLGGAETAPALLIEGLRIASESASAEALRPLAEAVLRASPGDVLAGRIVEQLAAAEFQSRAAEAQRDREAGREATRAEDWKRAVTHLERIHPEFRDWEVQHLLSRALEASGEFARAVGLYRGMSPSPGVLAALARCEARLGHFEEARTAVKALVDSMEPGEPPRLGGERNALGLLAEAQGDLRKAAQLYDDETLLHSLVGHALAAGDAEAELEALSVLAGRRPSEYRDEFERRLDQLEARMPVRVKSRFSRGRYPALVLCDTNVLLSRVLETAGHREELQELSDTKMSEKFETLSRKPREARMAVTPAVRRELRAVLLQHRALRKTEEAVAALTEVLDHLGEFLQPLEVERVAGPVPPARGRDISRVREFYERFGDRLRAITMRKVRQNPERKRGILRRRGVADRERPLLPEANDLRLLAEAALLAAGPLPGFGQIQIFSADADFRSFAAEIEREFGVAVC